MYQNNLWSIPKPCNEILHGELTGHFCIYSSRYSRGKRTICNAIRGDKCIRVHARRRGLPGFTQANVLMQRTAPNCTFLQFSNFRRLTRCLPSASLGHATFVDTPSSPYGPCSNTICHLSLHRFRNFNSHSSTRHSNWSYNSNFDMKLEFLFTVLQLWPGSPSSSFAEKGQDNSPASGAGKTGLFCSLLSLQLSIEVRD